MKHGHVTGKKVERRHTQAAIARYTALGAQIAQAIAAKSQEERVADLAKPFWRTR